MAAKIIQFPRSRERVSKLVDEILETRLTHSNPDVLLCLREELKELIEKYFPSEEFTATLILPGDLTEAQFKTIEENFQAVFQEHNDRMIRRANALFFDLCLSRMAICELRHKPQDGKKD
jgi:septum formation topological specificity factor MinE